MLAFATKCFIKWDACFMPSDGSRMALFNATYVCPVPSGTPLYNESPGSVDLFISWMTDGIILFENQSNDPNTEQLYSHWQWSCCWIDGWWPQGHDIQSVSFNCYWDGTSTLVINWDVTWSFSSLPSPLTSPKYHDKNTWYPLRFLLLCSFSFVDKGRFVTSLRVNTGIIVLFLQFYLNQRYNLCKSWSYYFTTIYFNFCTSRITMLLLLLVISYLLDWPSISELFLTTRFIVTKNF